MEHDVRKERSAAHALTNNFHAAGGGFLDSDRMKYYVRRIRQTTGVSEQAVIMRMLWFAFENCADYEILRETLRAEYDARMAVEGK